MLKQYGSYILIIFIYKHCCSFPQIIVHSVPGPPGGVSAVELTSDSGTIVWTDGAIYGRPIVNYRIEGRTNHDPTWRILADKVVGNEIEHLGHRAKIHGRRQVNLYRTR